MLHRPLQQPYNGPFKVLQRKDKVFSLTSMVSGYLYLLIDANLPSFLTLRDLQLPQTKNETPATVEPNATAPTASTPTQPSTRSGRKVHLPTSGLINEGHACLGTKHREFRVIDHMTEASAHAAQHPRSRILRWAQQEFYPYCIEDTYKSTPEKIVLRINLENEEEAENFKNRYSVVSNTNWIFYGCTPNPQRFVFSKIWICHNSKQHKRNARRNAVCIAKLSIVIKKITKGTKKNDKYLKYDIPLVGEVKISLLHSHNTSAETLKMLRVNDEVCQQFYQYFSDGKSPIEAIRFHENKFLLEDNFMGLINASINPTHNQIYYLHKCCRDANLGSSINPFDKLKAKVPFYESIGKF
ncbi:SWIM-type domain-containing protein [Trichonephila clavipes]|nr:SWIM-type domain-containing protein [Trichonephila clavipes]